MEKEMFFRPKYYRNYEKIILKMNGGNFLSFRELSNQATNLFKHLSGTYRLCLLFPPI